MRQREREKEKIATFTLGQTGHCVSNSLAFSMHVCVCDHSLTQGHALFIDSMIGECVTFERAVSYILNNFISLKNTTMTSLHN